MPDVTAKIAGKGTDGTGLTEDHAAEMFTRIGKHWMAIVEIQAVRPHGPDIKGNKSVDLIITQIEVGDDAMVEDHLRELTRTMHQNRALRSEDAQLEIATGDDIAPRPADVIATGQAHVTHDYVADDTDPAGGCETCEKPSDDPIHTILDDLEDPEPDDEQGDDDQGDGDGDGDEEPADPESGWADAPPNDELRTDTRPLSSVPDPFTAPA